MMREAQIICPVEGGREAREAVETAICKAWGGYTSTTIQGAWYDGDGQLVMEDGKAYTIAMEDTGDNALLLTAIARFYARDAEQDCVYVRLPTGRVVFLTP